MDNMQQDLARVSDEKKQLYTENEELRKVVEELQEKLVAKNLQFEGVMSSRAVMPNGDNNGQAVNDQLIDGRQGSMERGIASSPT